MAPRFDLGASGSVVTDEGAFVVRRIGPDIYSIALEVEGKTLMLAADYFTSPSEVETAITWLKRHAAGAKVIWRD